jgi:hypothetical protein
MQSMVPSPGGGALAPDLFSHSRYVITRPWFSFFERRFFVHAPDGRQLLFVKHPMMRWREEFNVYTDASEQTPVFRIQARQAIALDYVHDVYDARAGEKIATFKRRGLKSIIRDVWDILDAQEQPIGLIEEQGSSLLRRFIPLLTSRHSIQLGGAEVARLQQKFRFFIKEFHLDITPGQARTDPRIALAGSLLAVMAESQREDRR